MAEFDQSVATRQAIRDAANSYLLGQLAGPVKQVAARLGVTERSVYRYRASAKGASSQRRTPPVGKLASGFKMKLDATIAVADDPEYARERTGIQVLFSPNQAATLLSNALHKPDEAWQNFFDVYVMPAGTVEDAKIRFQ